jgi:hypothetical protein
MAHAPAKGCEHGLLAVFDRPYLLTRPVGFPPLLRSGTAEIGNASPRGGEISELQFGCRHRDRALDARDWMIGERHFSYHVGKFAASYTAADLRKNG